MTKAEWIAYRRGRAARKRGEECPDARPSDGLAWAFFLGWTNAEGMKMVAQAMDREVTRLLAERAELRKALLDALTVFDIGGAGSTRFHATYANVIRRANAGSI
jgi:hypothetical protein